MSRRILVLSAAVVVAFAALPTVVRVVAPAHAAALPVHRGHLSGARTVEVADIAGRPAAHQQTVRQEFSPKRSLAEAAATGIASPMARTAGVTEVGSGGLTPVQLSSFPSADVQEERDRY